MKQPPTLQDIKAYADYLFEGANEPPVADLENGPQPEDCEWRPTPYKDCWRASSSTLRGLFTGKELEWQKFARW